MYFDGYSSDTEDEKKDQQKDQQDDIVLTGSGKPVTPVAPKKSEPQEDIDLKGSGKTVTKPVVAPTVQTPSQVTKPAEKQVLQAPQVRVTKAQPQELKITIPDYIANTRKRLAEAKTPAERENIVRNSTSLLVRKDRLDVDAPELSKALYNTDEQGNSTIKFGIVNDQFPDEPDIAKRFPDGTSVVIPVNLPLSATKDEIKYQMNNLALEKLTANANVRAAVANQTTFQYNYGTDEKPDWVAPESMAELPLLMDDADNRGLNYQVTPEMIQAIKVGEYLDSIGQPLDNLYGKAKELSDFVGTYFKNMKEATSKWASNGRGLGIGEQLWENEWANIQSYKGGELYSGVMKILGVPEESITDYPRFKTNPEFDTFPAETATYKPEFKNFVGNLSSFVLEPAEAALEKAKRIKDPTITGFLKSLSLFVSGPTAGTWTDVGEYAGQSQAGVRELTAAIVPVVALTGITVATGGGGALAEGAGLLRLATALRFSGHVVNYGYMGWNAYTATQRMDTKSSTALIGGMALGILGQKFGGSKVLSAITEGTKYGRLAPSIVTGGSNAVGAIIVNGAMWDSFKKRDGSGDTDWALAFANILGDAGVFVASDVPAFRKALKSALPVERSVGFNQFVQDTSGNVFGFVKSQNDIVRMIPLTKEQFDATSKVLKENGMEPIVYDEFSPDALSQFRAGLEPNFKETLSKVYFGRDTELQKRILSTGFNGFNKDLTWGETKPIIRKQAPAQDRSMIVLEQLRSGGSLELGKADASFNQTVEKLRGEGLVEIVNGENGALDYVRLTETGKKTVETLHKKAQSSLQKLFDITEQRKKNMDPLTMEDTADWPPKDLEDYRKEAGKGKYVTKYINNDNPVEISPLEFGGMTPAEQKAIGYAVTLGKLQVDGDGFITRPNYESKYTSGGANVRIKFGNSYGDYRNQKLYELGEALNSGDKKRATALRKSLEGQVAGDLDSLAEAVYSGTSIEIGKTADKTGKVQISEYEFDPNVVLNPQVWSDPIEISIDRSGPNPVLAQVTADKRPEAVAEVESKPVEGSTVKSLPSELLIVDAQGRTQRYVKTKGLYHPANANPEMGIPEARMLADVQAGRVKVRIPEGTATIQVAPKAGQDYVSGLDNFANPSNSKGAAEAVYVEPSKYGSDRPWREGERYRFEWNGKEAVVRKNPEVKFTGWTPTEIAQDQTDWIKANSDYMTGKSDKPVNTAKERTPMFNMDLATMSDTEKAARFDASRPWGSERSRFDFNTETKRLEEVPNPNYKSPREMTNEEIRAGLKSITYEPLEDPVINKEIEGYSEEFAQAVRRGTPEAITETALKIKELLDAKGVSHRMSEVYEQARAKYVDDDLYMQNPLIRGVVRKLGLGSLFKLPSLDEEAAFKNRTGKIRVGKKEKIDLSDPIFKDGADQAYIRSKEDPNRFYLNKEAMDRITLRKLAKNGDGGVKAGVTFGREDAWRFKFAPEIQKLLESNKPVTVIGINPAELDLSTVRTAVAHEKVHELILGKASTAPELVAVSDALKKYNVFGDADFGITRKLFNTPELQGLLNHMKEFATSDRYVDSETGKAAIFGQYTKDLRDADGNYLPVEQIEGRKLGKIAHEILAYGTGLKTIEPLVGQTGLLKDQALAVSSRLDATESIFADAYARVLEELTKVHGTEFEKAILALADSPLRKYVKDYKKGKFTAERSIGQLGLKYIESNAGRYPNLDGRLGDAENGGFQSTEGKSARTYEDLALLPRAKYVESIDSLRAGTGPVHLRDDLVLDASHPIFTNSEPSFIDVDGMPFGNEAYINDLAMARTVHGSGVKDIEKKGGFNTDFIGTGEGNQAFGWGLYNAEAEPTGHVYRRIGSNYTDVQLVFDGEPLEMFKGLRRVGERFLRFGSDIEDLERQADYLRVVRNNTRPEFVKEYQNELNKVNKEILKLRRVPLSDRWRESIVPYLTDLMLDVEDLAAEARKWANSDPDFADTILDKKRAAEAKVAVLENILKNPEKLTVETGGALYRNLLKPEQHEYFLLDQKFEGQSDFFKQAVNNEVTLPDGTKMKLIDAMNMGGANEVVPYHQYTFSPENQKLVDQLPKLPWIRDLFDRTIITGSYDLPDPAKDIPRILEGLRNMKNEAEAYIRAGIGDMSVRKAQLEAIEKAIEITSKLDPNSNSWVRKMPVDILSGKELLDGMETEFGPRSTSMMLLEAGIKGNKFLDGLSRNKGEGTYNYVNFRAEDVQILAVERGVYRIPDFNKNPEGAYRLLSLAMAGLNENFKENLPVDINVNKLADDMDLAMTKSASIRLLDEVNHRYLKDMSTDELQGLAMNRLAELDIRNSVHHPAKIYREMFDVKVSRDAQGNLLAPNGRVSLLPEMQYRKVRTPTFKNWFGDWENDPANASKMVDENGEPLLLWHGSRQDFYQLDPLYSQTGYIYATRDFDWAKGFANNWSEPRDSFIYPLYGNVRNPLDFTELGQGMLSPRDTRLDSLGSYGDVARIYPFDTDNMLNDIYSSTIWSGIRRYSVIKGNDFIKQFTNSSFDGIIQLEEGSPNSSRVVATRSSFSFKSAMGDQFGFNADLLAMSPKSRVATEIENVRTEVDSENRLLAPDGSISEMSPLAWKIVRTPSFLDFFGDWRKGEGSLVLDRNGEPWQLGHGNQKTLRRSSSYMDATIKEGKVYKQGLSSKYDPLKHGPLTTEWEANYPFSRIQEPIVSFYPMSHFGPQKQFDTFTKDSGMWGNFNQSDEGVLPRGHVYPVFLNLRNPIRLQDYGYGNWNDSIGVRDQILAQHPDDGNEALLSLSEIVMREGRGRILNSELLKALGYDGIVYVNRHEGLAKPREANDIRWMTDSQFEAKYKAQDSFVALESKTQVKSLFSNAFDTSVDDTLAMTPLQKAYMEAPMQEKFLKAPSHDFIMELADEYESLKNNPSDERVSRAYDALVSETASQYRAIRDSGIKVEAWTGEGEPYKSSKQMFEDIKNNNHYYFLKTDNAYGSGNESSDNVMLRMSEYTDSNGTPLLNNDVFRIVHDLMGHLGGDFQFGPRGEFNAFATHSQMYSESAFPALMAETFMQNAVVTKYNYDLQDGVYKLNTKDVRFAEQKNVVPSEETIRKTRELVKQAYNGQGSDLFMSVRKTYGGSGELELTLKRFTPTGNPFDLTGRNGAERRLREGGNPTWNFYAKGVDDYVIEPEFAHTTMPFTEITGTFNLLDVSQDAEALKYYRENRFQDFEKWATEKGYDGFYAGHPDIAEWMRMRVALFSNEKNRTTIETAIANGEDALAMTRQRAVDVTYRDPEDHTVSSVKDLLKMGNVSVISGNKLERLTKALDEAGFSYLPVENENFDGVAVYYPFPNTSAIVDYIAMKQGQESVIHSLGGKVTQRYVNGQFKGTEMTSLGTDNSLTIKTSNGSVPLNFYFNHEQRQPFQFRPLIAEQRLKAQKELFGTSIITPADMERIVRGQADYTDSDGNIITMESVRDRGGRIVAIPEYDHKGRMFITVGNEKVTLKNGKGKDKAGNIYYYDKSTRDLTGALGMFQTLMTEWNPRVKGELTPAKKMAVWEKHLHGLLDQWFRDGFRGADWYENEIARYADTVGKSIPDVKADLGQLTLFMLTATTSGGTNVPLNAKIATSIMRPIVHYFETGKLFLPEFQGKIGENGYELLVKDSEPVKYAGSSYQESMSKIEALSRGYIPLKTSEAKRLVKAGATPVGRDEIFGGRFKGGATKKFVASPQLQADIAEYGVLQGVLHHLLGESETDFNKASEIFGKKYGAFFSNLAGLHNNPTIDSWMVRYFGALTGDAVSVERTRSGKLISVKDNTSKLLKSDGITDMMRAVVQKVSKEWGDRNGTELNPAATQAITWTVVKDLFNSLMTNPAPNVGYGEVAQKLKIDYVKSNPDMVKEFTPESPLLKEWVDGTLADGYGSTYYIDQQGDMLAMTPRKAYFADTGKKVDFNEPALASMDPDEWLTLASRTVKGGMLTGAEMDAIRKYADEGDFDRLVETVLNLNRMPMRELFVNVIKANPLTSPAVWYGNILNNITMQAVEEVARLPRFVIDGIGAAFTRELRPSGSYIPFLNEGFARATGSIFKGVKGVPESMAGAGDAIPSRSSGLKQFWDTMVHGDSEIGFEHPYYMRERTTGAGIFGVNLLYPVEWYTKMVFRFQSAMDKPFREFAYTRNMEEIMSTDKRYKGLSREDKIRLFNSSPEDVDRAMTMALYSTFQSDNKIASKLYKWIDSKPPFVKEALQINLPYIKTPSNIFLATLDYAGLGPLLKGAEGAWELKRDKRWSELVGSLTDLYKEEGFRDTLTRALGRGMIGWSMAYIGYALAEKGLVSLDYDSGDNKEQSQDRLRGINPASLTIGKFSIPISRFNPLAFMISAGAIAQNENAEALKSIEKGADPSVANSKARSQAIQKTFFSLMNAFGPLSTAYRTMKDVGAGKFSAAKFLGVDRMVPASGFMGELARTQDDYKRKLDINKMTEWETAKAMWMNKLPKTGLNPEFNRQSLPPQVDMLGRLIPREEGIMEAKSTAGRLFDPLSNATVIKNDAIADAIDKFDLNFNEKPPDGVEYSEGWEAMVDKGQFIEGKFKKTMASPVYEQMDDIGKKRLLKDTLRYFQTEYRKDQRTDEEEDFNQNMIINRVAFQREFAKNPDKYTKSPVQITDKDTLDNINRNKLDVTISGMLKFYQEQAIREKILADNRKEKYEGNTELTDNNKLYAWIGKKFRDYFFAGERKADVATQNYQKFLENPTATMIKWYVNQIASQKDKERTAKYREELKAKGLTEEQITKELRKRAGKLGRQTRIKRKPIVIQP